MFLSPLFISVSMDLNLPTGLLNTLCRVESGLNPKALNVHDGGSPSYGVCQVKYQSAKLVGFKGSPKQLMDPKVNIDVAGRILSAQYKRYGNWAKAVTAYNKGNSSSHGGSAYLARVFDAYFDIRPEGFHTKELRAAPSNLRRENCGKKDAEGEEFSFYPPPISSRICSNPGPHPSGRPNGASKKHNKRKRARGVSRIVSREESLGDLKRGDLGYCVQSHCMRAY